MNQFSRFLLAVFLLAQNCSAFVPKPTAAGVAPKASPGMAGMAPLTSPTKMPGSSPTVALYATVSRKEQERQEWIQRSVDYYSKVMREERRRSMGQWPEDNDYQKDDFVNMAHRHYFAIEKVRNGKYTQAETLYRRIIDEIVLEDEHHCDHAKLAVTTLLLALLTKRMNDPKKTRSVFLQFFRLAVLEREEGTECACSAKVLQAYALFEMQQGNSLKSYELVQKALQFDSSLAPVLKWKQFQKAAMVAAAYGR